MNRLHYFFLSLVALCLLGACAKEEVEATDDPEVAESLVGLWYGESVDGTRHLVDLRADRTGVYSTYHYMLHETSTSTFSGWTAGDGLFVGGNLRGTCRWDYLEMLDPSQRLYVMHHIFSEGRSSVSMTDLAGKTWTGYYEQKIITLEFRADGTMTRTDSPNAGWDFEPVTQAGDWSVVDNVLHFNSFPGAWGVTVEEDARHGDAIFVDFGDAASVFVEE